MPRKKSANTEKLPKAPPKRPPKVQPIRRPEVKPEALPKVVPIKRSARRPIVASTVTPEASPENTVYLGYGLDYYDVPGHPGYRKCHPKFYGKCYGEHVTERDLKDALRRHEQYGYFAVAERINGKIGNSWPIEIEEPEEIETGEELVSDDLAYVDFDNVDPDTVEIFRNPLVRAEVEKARLKAENAALRNAPAHNGYDPVTKTIVEQVVPQLFKPPKSTTEQIRELLETKQAIEALSPRREVNPAPAPAPQAAPDLMTTALKIIAEKPEAAETVRDFVGLKSESERDAWAEVAMEFVKSGQAAPVVQAAINGLGNLFANLLPKPAQSQAPDPAQTQQQAPQQTQPAQQQQPQIDQGPAPSPQDALLYGLIGACEQNAPIGDVQNFINLSLIRNPELEDSLDQLLSLPTDQLLGLAVSIHPPLAQAAHAKKWLESLTAALTAEGDTEFTEKEI